MAKHTGATVYSPPEEVPPPEFEKYKVDGSFNLRRMEQVDARYIERLRAWLKDNGFVGELAGEEVSWPIADGYARYVIASREPLVLIHLPLGDAYQKEDAFMRGLTADDVTEAVQREKALRELFSKRAEDSAR